MRSHRWQALYGKPGGRRKLLGELASLCDSRRTLNLELGLNVSSPELNGGRTGKLTYSKFYSRNSNHCPAYRVSPPRRENSPSAEAPEWLPTIREALIRTLYSSDSMSARTSSCAQKSGEARDRACFSRTYATDRP